MFKKVRVRDEKHRRWIASLPCCVSGVQGQTQAAHVRHNNAGMGLKSGDDYCVPLSVEEHRLQHTTSEVKYWGERLEAAKDLANALYIISGDDDKAQKLLVRFRKKIS